MVKRLSDHTFAILYEDPTYLAIKFMVILIPKYTKTTFDQNNYTVFSTQNIKKHKSW